MLLSLTMLNEEKNEANPSIPDDVNMEKEKTAVWR